MFAGYKLPGASMLAAGAVVISIALACFCVLVVFKRVLAPLVKKAAHKSALSWIDILVSQGVVNRLGWIMASVAAYRLALVWLGGLETFQGIVLLISRIFIVFSSAAIMFAFLDVLAAIYNSFARAAPFPVRVVLQVAKIITIIFAVIVFISLLLDKSPFLLVSGLGAMTAILMLVFKDAILGLVAGVQLSANRMLMVGDWLEMPKYNADGDVIDITLTTVKVRNWDKTITTIPTYALIADSFKNWRGMSEAGGRRISRSIMIDMMSVAFLDDETIEELKKLRLLTGYLESKTAEISEYNKDLGADGTIAGNGRRLTNLGTFRAYLSAYIENHSGIHKDLTYMVRQLAPTPQGIPLQIYAFTNDIRWVQYEGIQADIFDHVIAVAPVFGLRIFQSPSGTDIRNIGTVKDIVDGD